MKIDLTKYKRHHWFEDEYGNVYDAMDANLPKDIDYFTYHCIETNRYYDTLDEYTYHPEYLHEGNHFYHAMLQFPWFYKFMLRRMKKKGMQKTFKRILTGNTCYGDWGAKCIAKMAESGDYTYGEAQYVFANSCERCMNVLLYKYLDGEDGYPWLSPEWLKCNTSCDFCRDYEDERQGTDE